MELFTTIGNTLKIYIDCVMETTLIRIKNERINSSNYNRKKKELFGKKNAHESVSNDFFNTAAAFVKPFLA